MWLDKDLYLFANFSSLISDGSISRINADKYYVAAEYQWTHTLRKKLC